MLDFLFTLAFIAVFIVAGYLIFDDDDSHDEWRGW